MKLLAGITVLAFLAIQVSGEDTFEEYLINLQYQVQSLHRRFEGTYDNARIMLTQQLEDLHQNGLDSILSAIEEAEAARQELQDLVDGLPSVGICVTGVVNTFNSRYSSYGVNLASCSANALASINVLTNEVHRIIDLGSVLSQEAQHLVVQAVATWNPVVHVEELSYIVNARHDELEAELYSNQSELQTALENVYDAVTTIPLAIGTCAEPIINDIQTASITAQVDVGAC